MAIYLIKLTKIDRETYKVIRRSNGLAVFFGTKAECVEWLERNGHDSDV